MPTENEAIRRWVAWAIPLVVVAALAGWAGYRLASDARQQEAARKQDEENLRMIRFHDSLRDLEAIGDAGDEPARARCRHAIHLLSLLEPGWYQTYRSTRPAPDWLPEPAGGKK